MGPGCWRSSCGSSTRGRSCGKRSPAALTGVPVRPHPTPALVLLADPEAVAQAIAAGVGERVRLTVGGKSDAPARRTP